MMSSSSLSPSIIVGCSLLTWKTEMAQSRRLWIKPPVPSPVPRTPLFRREPTPETNSRHAARRSVAVATEVWSWDEQLCQMHCYCSLRWLTYSSEAWLSLCLKVSRVINLGKPASSYTYYCLAMFPAACLYTWAVLPWARILRVSILIFLALAYYSKCPPSSSPSPFLAGLLEDHMSNDL